MRNCVSNCAFCVYLDYSRSLLLDTADGKAVAAYRGITGVDVAIAAEVQEVREVRYRLVGRRGPAATVSTDIVRSGTSEVPTACGRPPSTERCQVRIKATSGLPEVHLEGGVLVVPSAFRGQLMVKPFQEPLFAEINQRKGAGKLYVQKKI